MSDTFNCSPFPAADTLQPYHKACDVTRSNDIKSRAALSGAVPCRSHPPDVSVQAPLDGAEESSMMERLLSKCQIKNQLLRECLAELLGVYVLIVSMTLEPVFLPGKKKRKKVQQSIYC